MVANISDWILSLHGALALGIVFAVPALEASAFLGFLFPGEIATVLGGVLAFNGRVPLLAVVVAAVLGAILGDTIGYFVGRRWGRRLLAGIGRRIPFLRHRVDEHLDRAQAYLLRRGGPAVFLGRFTAALRVMVPGLAGMSEMPYGQFFVYNAAGGLIWGAGFVLLGYFAGAAWHRVASDASKVGLGLLALILLGLVGDRVLRSLWRQGRSLADRAAAIPPIAWLRRRYPRTSAWLARRVDPGSRTGFALSFVVVTGAACGWLFGGLTQDVVAREEAVRLDPGVLRFVVSHRVGWATDVMKGITWLGSSAVVIPLGLLVGGYFLLRKRDWRPLALIAAALAGAIGLYEMVKPAVGRLRPPPGSRLIHVTGRSFPSGHAVTAVAFWGMLAVILSSGLPARRRVLVWSVAGAIAMLVGVSRLYLGVHWFTDVIGGYALGGLWLCVVGAVVIVGGARRRSRSPTPGARPVPVG